MHGFFTLFQMRLKHVYLLHVQNSCKKKCISKKGFQENVNFVSCRLLCASVCVGVLFLYFLLWVKTWTGTQLILQYYFIDWNVHTTQCCLCDGGVESSLTLFIKQLKIICTLKRNMCRKSSQSQSDLNGQVRNRFFFFFFFLSIIIFFFNVPLFFSKYKIQVGWLFVLPFQLVYCIVLVGEGQSLWFNVLHLLRSNLSQCHVWTKKPCEFLQNYEMTIWRWIKCFRNFKSDSCNEDHEELTIWHVHVC